MKTRKSILAILLVIALIATFAACTQTPAATPTPAPVNTPAPGTDPTPDPGADLGGFPSRNISWVVPAPAGAPLDIPTRVLVDVIDLGANVVIENIPGAANVVGILDASGRAPDGYTVLTTSAGGMVAQPALMHTGYLPSDFRHIVQLQPVFPYVVVMLPDAAVTNGAEWIDFVQSGDRFTYSVANPGSISHLVIEFALGELGSTSGTFVPYTGGAEALAAVVTGEIDFAVLPAFQAVPNIEAGTVQAVIILGDIPHPLLPDVQLAADFNMPGIERFLNPVFVSIHVNTPDAIVEFIKAQITAAIATPEYQEYILQTTGISGFVSESEAWLTDLVHGSWEIIVEILDELDLG